MSAPAAFARALLAAHYLLPFCGLSVSARDSVGARLGRAAHAAGLSLDAIEATVTITFPATPAARLELLRDELDRALYHAPDAAYPELERAAKHLPCDGAPATEAASLEGGA